MTTRPARRWLIRALERACSVLDRIPYYDRTDRRWYAVGAWGCHLNLAATAYALDTRWGTNAWTPVADLP